MHSSSPDNVAKAPTHTGTIKLRLHDLSQLFNSMDPSPFIEKDLDDDAVEFILDWAEEFSPETRLKLRVYLEEWPEENPTELIRQAVHNYFAHRSEMTGLQLRHLFKQGRTTLFIGLSFLVVCLATSRALLRGDAGTWAAVLRESLTIAGWVAMWRPMQIYLYDWWPLRRRGRIYTKLSHMSIEVVPKEKG